MPIVFAAFSPHPPIILPDVGSKKDRALVKNTIESLEKLGEKFAEAKPDILIISSPHPDWGFAVPLHFLAKDFRGKIKKILIGSESPRFYFEKGAEFPIFNFQFSNKSQTPNPKIAFIASGDMSHCLKKDGPYGFHPDGPKFDKAFIAALKKKDIETILKLDEIYPEAAECGLRSFCFLLGVLEGAKTDPAAKNSSGVNWRPEILSYEGPFGVGYFVADFNLN
jgi:aromatic ring-opening dioxygenase LigB subunit